MDAKKLELDERGFASVQKKLEKRGQHTEGNERLPEKGWHQVWKNAGVRKEPPVDL